MVMELTISGSTATLRVYDGAVPVYTLTAQTDAFIINGIAVLGGSHSTAIHIDDFKVEKYE